jgi:hypothetical protein
MSKPQAGEQIRIVHTSAYGEELGTHICTIVDVLAVQLRATYEVAREDGGWKRQDHSKVDTISKL